MMRGQARARGMAGEQGRLNSAEAASPHDEGHLPWLHSVETLPPEAERGGARARTSRLRLCVFITYHQEGGADGVNTLCVHPRLRLPLDCGSVGESGVDRRRDFPRPVL